MQLGQGRLTRFCVSTHIADVLGRSHCHALVLVKVELKLCLGFVAELNQGHLFGRSDHPFLFSHLYKSHLFPTCFILFLQRLISFIQA